VGDPDISQVDSGTALAFIAGTGPVTSFWHRKFETLTGFYRFAIGRRHVALSPLPTTAPKRPQPLVPYIYGAEELRRLLAATVIIDLRKCQLQGATFRTLLLVLIGTGLRVGEAMSLTVDDVDLAESLLTVRESKFYKSRLVPMGPRLTEALCVYAKGRRKPRSNGAESPFFSTRGGTALTHRIVHWHFCKLRVAADVRRDDGGRYQPRLHDFRHTFAVRRLVAWYREGADVQRLLPQLSTYLGHVHIGATQRYLTMTPELLNEANRRFERYALSEAYHV
jgi:integrase